MRGLKKKEENYHISKPRFSLVFNEHNIMSLPQRKFTSAKETIFKFY